MTMVMSLLVVHVCVDLIHTCIPSGDESAGGTRLCRLDPSMYTLW